MTPSVFHDPDDAAAARHPFPAQRGHSFAGATIEAFSICWELHVTDLLFNTASLLGETISLDFTASDGSQVAVAIPRDNANELVGALLHCLRAAHQQGQRIRLVPLGEGAFMSVHDMPLMKSVVGISNRDAGRTFLNLVTEAGLSLTYSLPNQDAATLGAALIDTAQKPRETAKH